MDIYEEVKQDHHYVVTVDVVRGDLNDNSAFIVFDTTQMPYKIDAKYKNNEVKFSVCLISLMKLQKIIIMQRY